MFPRLTQQATQTPDEVVAQSALTQQVEQFEKKLVEQQRKDKEQRQSEQIKMTIQLKDFETQLQQQLKRDYEFQQREHQHIQQQIRDYTQKLINQQTQGVLGGIVAGKVYTETQVQQQVRDFERMLVEKQQHEVDRRQRVHFHLQQKIKEFERLLCEQQQMEFQHLIHTQDGLKQVGINSGIVGGNLVTGSTVTGGIMGGIMGLTGGIMNGLTGGIMNGGINGGMWAEKQQVLEQQTQEEKVLKQKQERLQKFVKEIESELNLRDVEQQKREVTVHLKSQQVQQQVQQAQQVQQVQQVLGGCVGTGMFGGVMPSGRYEQIQTLEQQLNEYKRILREKLREQQFVQQPFCQQPFVSTIEPITGVPCVGGPVQQQIQQILTVEWIKTLVQKLRELEGHLVQQGTLCWVEKILQQLRTHISFFDQVELVQQQQYQCQQQLLKLRDLLEYDLPVEFRHIGGQSVVLRQFCNELVQLIEEKIRYLVPTEVCVTGMPVEKLWQKLRNVEYRLRDLRQGEYEPHWQQIYKRIYQLEQVFQQPQFGGVCGMPITQKVEYVQEQIQQLECLIQEIVCLQRQVPFKYQIVRYQQQKHICKRLVQLIDDIECQIQEIKIQTPVGISQEPIQYQAQMILRQLRGLRTQVRCLLQQQSLVVMHQRMQQLVFDYERQMPKELIENRQHYVQLQQVMQVLKCLEQQLVEQHLQYYQQQQQQQHLPGQFYNGFFCVEDVIEQIKQQFYCQKQLQQVIREFATLLVQQKQHIPVGVRVQIQQILLQQVREFENILNQCNEVVVDQEHYLQWTGIQVPQCFIQQYQTHHQQIQGLFKQLHQVLITVQQVPQQYIPYQQHQQLVNSLLQQVQQIQMQHQQQLVNYQQYPQFTWWVEQQQRSCVRRLTHHLQQLQTLQQLPTDLLSQQQQHILLQQVQQQLQQLIFIQSQYQKIKSWKNWQSWSQTHIPQFHQTLQQLRQQQQHIRVLQQQLQECQQYQRMIQTYGPMRHMIKSISQPTLTTYEPVEEYETICQDYVNNNYPSTWYCEQPELFGDEFVVNFYNGKEIEQEQIIQDMIQKYVNCINGTTTGINGEFRKRFETLYFENGRFGQTLRSKVNEVAQLRKIFEEIQATRGFTTPCYPFGGRIPTTYRTPYPVMGGCVEYESLPITGTTTTGTITTGTITTGTTGVFGEENVMMPTYPECYQQKPSLRCVEQLLNNLENKLTQLRLDGGVVVPTTTCGPYTVEPTTVFGRGIYEPIQIVAQPGTVGTSTVVEVTKKQQYPNSQVSTTQIYQEFKICPVCGIAVEKELSQPEFELHVNSHFPFTD